MCAPSVHGIPPRERLAAIFTGIRHELLSLLVATLGNRSDAEDVVQTTFLKCWQAHHRLEHVRDFRAWIFSIGLNAARDLQRSVWRRRAKPLEAACPLSHYRVMPSPTEEAIRQEDVGRLQDALVHLPRKEREVFLLRQDTHLTLAEIAHLLHRPVPTVKTQLRGAMHKLRDRLQDRVHA